MSIENMSFENEIFDFVIGLGALHHLNLDLASKEIYRILKPGGKVIFLEPRIPFKWLIVLRSFLPIECHESPGGSQLTDIEVSKFSKLFSSSHIEYFIFLKKFPRFPVIKSFSPQLEKIDSLLLKKFPYLKNFYWSFVLEFTK